MKISYKLIYSNEKHTVIYEYWDDIHIYKYTVFRQYLGGDIKKFIEKNDIVRCVTWDGLDEFHRRTMILDL